MNLSEKGIIVRKTIEADLAQIYSTGIAEPFFKDLPFVFSAENIADIFAMENSICFTAVRKKKVLGFIAGSVKDRRSQIHWMMVKDTFRKAGIGEELLKQYLESSKKYGAVDFLIAVLKNSPEPVKFFESRDFTIKENFVELHRKI